MKKPTTERLNGLVQLATKYTSKALGINPKSITITPQDKSLLITVDAKKHFDKSHLQRLARILRTKGLKVGAFGFEGGLNKTQQHTKLAFDLTFIKQTRKPRSKLHSSLGDMEMDKSLVLANSLAQNMRFAQVTATVDKMLIKAGGDAVLAEGGGMGIKVMRAGDGSRLVQQLYNDYISDRDYTGFLEFYKSIDDTMFKFRGNKELDLSQLEDDDDDDRGRRRGKKGRKSFAPKSSGRTVKQDSGLNNGNNDEVTPDPSDSSVVISRENLNKKPKSDILAKLNKYYG